MFYAALIYILAVVSPEPNFILVSRYSSLGNIKLGISVTLGICSVGVLFSTLSLLGISSLLNYFPNFSNISVVLGAIYLIFIAYIIFKGTFSKNDNHQDNQNNTIISNSLSNAYFIGAMTNLFNMKTIAFMISIYSGFLIVHRSTIEKISIVAICSSLEFFWYFVVALVFSKPLVQRVFFKHRKSIDRGLSLFLVLFALQNIYAIY